MPRRLWHSPQSRPNSRQQLRHAEGFGDVVIGSRVQSIHLIPLRVAHREHDNRGGFGAGTNQPAGFHPTHSGHVHIQEHQIETARAQFFQPLFARTCIAHLISVGGQSGPHGSPNLRVIVNHQDSACAHSPLLRGAIGKVNENSEPCPGILATEISSPCARIISRAMARPIPVPLRFRSFFPR